MIQLLPSIKYLTALIALILFATSVYAWMPPVSWVGAIFTSTFSTLFGALFGAISYVGFKVERKITDATQTAYDIVGESAEKVSDAVVERVRKV